MNFMYGMAEVFFIRDGLTLDMGKFFNKKVME